MTAECSAHCLMYRWHQRSTCGHNICLMRPSMATIFMWSLRCWIPKEVMQLWDTIQVKCFCGLCASVKFGQRPSTRSLHYSDAICFDGRTKHARRENHHTSHTQSRCAPIATTATHTTHNNANALLMMGESRKATLVVFVVRRRRRRRRGWLLLLVGMLCVASRLPGVFGVWLYGVGGQNMPTHRDLHLKW